MDKVVGLGSIKDSAGHTTLHHNQVKMSQDFAPNEPSITTSDGLDKITIVSVT